MSSPQISRRCRCARPAVLQSLTELRHSLTESRQPPVSLSVSPCSAVCACLPFSTLPCYLTVLCCSPCCAQGRRRAVIEDGRIIVSRYMLSSGATFSPRAKDPSYVAEMAQVRERYRALAVFLPEEWRGLEEAFNQLSGADAHHDFNELGPYVGSHGPRGVGAMSRSGAGGEARTLAKARARRHQDASGLQGSFSRTVDRTVGMAQASTCL